MNKENAAMGGKQRWAPALFSRPKKERESASAKSSAKERKREA
jgi:hypothetical protein